MIQKTKAIELADQLDAEIVRTVSTDVLMQNAATELRRLSALERGSEPVAWITEDGERCVTAKTMESAKHDGGAMLSSLQSYVVPAFRHPAADLTDEQIDAVIDEQWGKGCLLNQYQAHRAFARAIIAKVKGVE